MEFIKVKDSSLNQLQKDLGFVEQRILDLKESGINHLIIEGAYIDIYSSEKEVPLFDPDGEYKYYLRLKGILYAV